MDKTIKPWEAEVDGGSATATPKPVKKLIPKPVTKDEPENDAPPTDKNGNFIKPRPYAKGGKTTAKCMARGGGVELRGKTKGRFV